MTDSMKMHWNSCEQRSVIARHFTLEVDYVRSLIEVGGGGGIE